MSTKAKTERKPKSKHKPAPGSDFLRAPELAERLGYNDTKALWRAIRDGIVPLPTHALGERIHLWRKADYEHFRDTGRWPKVARFQPPA